LATAECFCGDEEAGKENTISFSALKKCPASLPFPSLLGQIAQNSALLPCDPSSMRREDV
jgi:hypothetical protein